MTSKRQSVKLEHIIPGFDTLYCKICKSYSSHMPEDIKEIEMLDFITAHRHEDIKSLEKGK